jgi:glucose-6-phosphate dehydrogenase assembly protein OpcA
MANDMSAVMSPERILRELQEQWVDKAHDDSESGGVLKACSMTLVVVAESPEDAMRVHETIAVLMHSHPSRSIVLSPGGAEDTPEARVFAECWKPLGYNQQICAEGIAIAIGDAEGEQVARFVAPLRVPDLPLVLWRRGALALEPGPFDALNALASKIIFDSEKAEDAQGAIDFLRGLRASGHRVADLHWTRLTGWREVLAHLFDDGAMDAKDVKSVRIGYGGATLSTSALYFAAWVRTALTGVRVTIAAEDSAPGIHSVTLAGAKGSLRLERSGDGLLKCSGCGRDYRTALPPADEESLMREELSIVGPDPVWERVLAS